MSTHPCKIAGELRDTQGKGRSQTQMKATKSLTVLIKYKQININSKFHEKQIKKLTVRVHT